jgi:hypothetical protein
MPANRPKLSASIEALSQPKAAEELNVSRRSVQYARSYGLEAERKMGQMLRETEKNVGAKGSVVTGSQRVPVKDNTPTLVESCLKSGRPSKTPSRMEGVYPTLKELGIKEKESSKAQF